MAQALLAPTTANFVQKALGAQLLAGATTMTLNNVVSIPNLPGVCIVDRINTNNVETPNTREVIKYTGTSGSTLTGLTRNADGSGSDQDHAINAIVEFGPDVLWADSVYDALTEVVVASTGALDTTKVVAMTGNQTIAGNKTFSGTTTFSADPTLATSGNLQVNGSDPKRAIYIPASTMIARTTNGAASGTSETATNKVMIKSYDFDKDTDEFIQFQMPSPKYWDAGTVTAEFYWTATSGSATETVQWAIQGQALANDDALDTAFGTAQSVSDALIATSDVHISSATSAVTIGGSPTAGDWIAFQIYRDVSEDTLAADAKLLGVRIAFTIGKYDDQ